MSEGMTEAAPQSEAPQQDQRQAEGQQQDIDVDAILKTRKFKVKAGDTEQELDFDTLKTLAQKGFGADRKFQEAAELRKKSQAEIEALKSGDYNELRKFYGKEKARELAEKLLLDELEYESMTDQEREAFENKKELERLRQEQKQREEQEKTQRQRYMEQQAAAEVDREIGDVLKSMKGKPSPLLVKRIAEHMLASLTRGERIKASDAYQRASQSYQQDALEWLSNLSADEVNKILPPEILKKIRKADLGNALLQTRPGRKTTQNQNSRKEQRAMKDLTLDEIFERKEKQLGAR